MTNAHHPAILGNSPGRWNDIRHWLVLAPHPDDFEVVALTMKHFATHGARISLHVLSGGASGVEDRFAPDWECKTRAREAEQRASCQAFGLPDHELHFHRLEEAPDGHLDDHEGNRDRVHSILESENPDGVILPHGNDSNADHRRTFRWFAAWHQAQSPAPLALFVRDPKNLGMRIDLITPFDENAAAWKAELLRYHASQHDRNLRTRGIGFDERILATDRAAGTTFGYFAAECFEIG